MKHVQQALYARVFPQHFLRPPAPLQGYAFAEYLDVHITDIVIQNLNGKPCNTKFLTGQCSCRAAARSWVGVGSRSSLQ